MEWLFSNFLEKATFDPGREAEGCISSLRGQLDRRLSGEYQVQRTGWVVLGILLSFVASVFMAAMDGPHPSIPIKFTAILFMTALLAALTAAFMLVPAIVSLVRGTARFSRLLLGGVLSGTAVAAAVGIARQLAENAPYSLALMVCLLVTMNIAAAPLLRYVTAKGMEARRHIEGFREYLLKVEQDPLNRMVKRDQMPPPTAALLGYAIALEVKEAWGDDLVNACYIG